MWIIPKGHIQKTLVISKHQLPRITNVTTDIGVKTNNTNQDLEMSNR